MSSVVSSPRPADAASPAPAAGAGRPGLGHLLGLGGSGLLLLSGLLSWCFDNRVLGDISIRLWPATLQIFAMVLGAVGLVLALVGIVLVVHLSPRLLVRRVGHRIRPGQLLDRALCQRGPFRRMLG